MDLDLQDGLIEITNVKGRTKDTRLTKENLPEVIVSERPIELEGGHGHRNSVGHHWQLDFDFSIDTPSTTISAKPHNHDYWEIIFIEAGTLNMTIESFSHRLERGDICVLNRATRHAEHFEAGQTVGYITLSRDYIATWPKDAAIGFRKPLAQLFENGINLPRYQNKDYIIATAKDEGAREEAFGLIEDMRREFLGGKPGSRYMVRGFVYRLLSLCTASDSYKVNYRDKREAGKLSLASEAKRYLDKHKRRTTLDDIEKALQYNGAYINRLFKEKYRCSIAEYNQGVCLRYMADQLLSTDLTVEAICSMIGFRNRTHIYELFKERYGCTPAEYRRK